MLKETYACPRCGNQITVHVKLTHAPLCNRHSSKPYEMEQNKTNGTKQKQYD